jgi:hypothetical protein
MVTSTTRRGFFGMIAAACALKAAVPEVVMESAAKGISDWVGYTVASNRSTYSNLVMPGSELTIEALEAALRQFQELQRPLVFESLKDGWFIPNLPSRYVFITETPFLKHDALVLNRVTLPIRIDPRGWEATCG